MSSITNDTLIAVETGEQADFTAEETQAFTSLVGLANGIYVDARMSLVPAVLDGDTRVVAVVATQETADPEVVTGQPLAILLVGEWADRVQPAPGTGPDY